MRTEYTGKNPMLVKGFDRVKVSQKTRWTWKRLSRVLYGALKAILVNICRGLTKVHSNTAKYSDTANQVQLLTQPII